MENHLSLEEPIESMHTARGHVFSDSVFCRGPGAFGSNQCFKHLQKKKAEAVMKSACCKNRNDIAGRSIDIERHVCPGDTSVQLLHQLQELMSDCKISTDIEARCCENTKKRL